VAAEIQGEKLFAALNKVDCGQKSKENDSNQWAYGVVGIIEARVNP